MMRMLCIESPPVAVCQMRDRNVVLACTVQRVDDLTSHIAAETDRCNTQYTADTCQREMYNRRGRTHTHAGRCIEENHQTNDPCCGLTPEYCVAKMNSSGLECVTR